MAGTAIGFVKTPGWAPLGRSARQKYSEICSMTSEPAVNHITFPARDDARHNPSGPRPPFSHAVYPAKVVPVSRRVHDVCIGPCSRFGRRRVANADFARGPEVP